jgi:N-acetylglucosamine-6-sulfatase
MDSSRLAEWTRRKLGLAAGGSFASLLGLLAGDESEAKNKNRRKRKRRKKRQKRRNNNQNQNPPPPPPCVGDACPDLPDIILINVDDMREEDYLALPQTRALIQAQGTTYPNYLLATPVCAPSRASLLRGQYTHNHGVLRNDGANGGWATFTGNGADQSTIATWLRGATPAYRTALIGKYLNGYRAARNAVAPGWTDWVVPVPVNFYDYTLNVNGAAEQHGSRARDYLTDVMAEKARGIIASTPAETPLFMYFAPKAPHGPATPARRHQGDFAGHSLDRSGAFNEEDITDKPAYMQRPLLDDAEIASLEQTDRNRLESLRAVDEAIAGIVEALRAAGRLERAYIVFVTDNGFLLGEHRRTAKLVPYEESIRMSMLVRGPGVRAGVVNEALVGNIDLAPTIAALAGVTPPGFVDGRSLVPTFDGSGSGRQAFLVAAYSGQESDPEEIEAEVGLERVLGDQRGVTPYRAIRTTEWMYVEYRNAERERELYDLNADPFQLESRHADPGTAAVREGLSAWLATLEGCSGQTCRNAENAPPLPDSQTTRAAD